MSASRGVPQTSTPIASCSTTSIYIFHLIDFDALQRSRIIVTLVLQHDGQFNPPVRSLAEAYQSLRTGLTSVSAQVLTIDNRSSTGTTKDLISIVQTAYSVSLKLCSYSKLINGHIPGYCSKEQRNIISVMFLISKVADSWNYNSSRILSMFYMNNY